MTSEGTCPIMPPGQILPTYSSDCNETTDSDSYLTRDAEVRLTVFPRVRLLYDLAQYAFYSVVSALLMVTTKGVHAQMGGSVNAGRGPCTWEGWSPTMAGPVGGACAFAYAK